MSKENCNEYLRVHKKAYPRTCKECGLSGCKYQPPGTPLKEMTLEQYQGLEKMGFLFKFYPEASGDWWEDCGKYQVKSSHDWLKEQQYKHLIIMGPDGWDRADFENSMAELINEKEFNRRVGLSTCLTHWELVKLVEFTD